MIVLRKGGIDGEPVNISRIRQHGLVSFLPPSNRACPWHTVAPPMEPDHQSIVRASAAPSIPISRLPHKRQLKQVDAYAPPPPTQRPRPPARAHAAPRPGRREGGARGEPPADADARADAATGPTPSRRDGGPPARGGRGAHGRIRDARVHRDAPFPEHLDSRLRGNDGGGRRGDDEGRWCGDGEGRWCGDGEGRWCGDGEGRWCGDGEGRWCGDGEGRWCGDGEGGRDARVPGNDPLPCPRTGPRVGQDAITLPACPPATRR